MHRFRGVYTALITPFTDIGTVDYQALERIVNQQIEAGIDGLVPCGTTGESPTLSHEEHDRVIAQTIKYAAGRVPVIAGTGSNATTEAIRLSQHAEDSGADAVLLVNPIKGRTGVNIETETLERLEKDCSNIVAVKEASGSLEQMKAVIETTSDDFMVLSGDDNLALELIRMGGDGVISVASNLFPREMVRMTHAALEGNWEEAERLGAWFSDFFSTCFIETNPIPIKTAMARMGWCRESFRLPMCTLESSEHRAKLFSVVDRMEEDLKEGRI